MEKINYFKKSLDIIANIDYTKRKPRILLHACCGPCSTYPIKFLSENNFDVTIYFNNSNIYPHEEYIRRLEELKRFIQTYNLENNLHIDLIIKPYDNETYNVDLEPYKSEPEGLSRCKICYRKRMKEAYDYADDNDFDFFTTVMTISRQKDSQILNSIGKELEEAHCNCKYLYSDFKKNKGIDIGREMRIYYDMYQQDYCGCKYTFPKSKMYQKNNK